MVSMVLCHKNGIEAVIMVNMGCTSKPNHQRWIGEFVEVMDLERPGGTFGIMCDRTI